MGIGRYKEGRKVEREKERKEEKRKNSKEGMSTLIHVINCWKKIDISHKTQVHSNRHKYFFLQRFTSSWAYMSVYD